MEYLNTQTVSTTFNTSSTVYQGSGGPFKLEVPQSSVIIPKPLSYEFRVAEYEDSEGNITQVGLQVAVFEHDNYGVRQLRQDWTPVKRVRLPDVR
jgi:hypothetical protein